MGFLCPPAGKTYDFHLKGLLLFGTEFDSHTHTPKIHTETHVGHIQPKGHLKIIRFIGKARQNRRAKNRLRFKVYVFPIAKPLHAFGFEHHTKTY